MTDIALKGWNGLKDGWDKISGVWLLIVLLPLMVLVLDPAQFEPVIVKTVTALLHTLPYIIVAVLLVAYLKATGAETLVARAFEGREVRMIGFAALIGGLAPFCSCEVIPFVAGLLAVGAPLSAVMAFWLSSPLVDPANTLITASALGWDFAAAKAVGAVSLGIFGGLAMMGLLRLNAFPDPLKIQETKSCCGSSCGGSAFQGKPVWKFWTEEERVETFRHEGQNNFFFLLKWLTLAYVLEALMITYVPAQMIAGLVGGDGVGSIAIGALLGMPAYLNSYVAPPMVAGLIEQGMSRGAAMAFLMAGAVSCIPAMAAVWSLVKPRVFAAYVVLGLIGAMMTGIVFQAVV